LAYGIANQVRQFVKYTRRFDTAHGKPYNPLQQRGSPMTSPRILALTFFFALLTSGSAWSSEVLCRGQDEEARIYQVDVSPSEISGTILTIHHPFEKEISISGRQLNYNLKDGITIYSNDGTKIPQPWEVKLIIGSDWDKQSATYPGALILKYRGMLDPVVVDLACRVIIDT